MDWKFQRDITAREQAVRDIVLTIAVIGATLLGAAIGIAIGVMQ